MYNQLVDFSLEKKLGLYGVYLTTNWWSNLGREMALSWYRMLLLLLSGFSSVQFSSVQSLSRVQLFATPWIAAHQASLSITNSWNLLKLTSIESVISSNHLILCHPSPFPPAFNLSQHQGIFKWVSSSHQVAKVLEFQLQHQSFQWIFRTDFL